MLDIRISGYILALTRNLGNLLGKTPVNKNISVIGIFLWSGWKFLRDILASSLPRPRIF
jgi:hypothetical protein